MTHHQTEATTLSLQWYIPDRVLYIVARGSLTDNDSLYANETLIQHLNQVDSPVHLLIDVTRVRKLATKLLHLQPDVVRHKLMGWIVTVGMQQNPIVNFGISALSPSARIRHQDCATIQDALAFLQMSDDDLPDLMAQQHRLTS